MNLDQMVHRLLPFPQLRVRIIRLKSRNPPFAEPEWVVEQVLETKKREMEEKDREIEQKLERIRAEEMKRRKIDEAKGRARVRKKQVSAGAIACVSSVG